MKLIYLFILAFLYSSPSLAYLSYGDASDTCNWTSNITLTKAVWNCSSLTIGSGVTVSFAASVTDPIQIRVKEDAVIQGTINISANGNTAGPGGGNGGTCTASAQCNNVSGSGSGAGGGGLTASTGGGAGASGGGGAGGSFGTVSVTSATAGSFEGSVDGAAGTNGSTYSSNASLSTTLVGGSGGGAGGSGCDTFCTTFGTGANGGGGGGAIAIIVKGDLTFSGTPIINAKGADGIESVAPPALTGRGGDGGAGSGGAIYLLVNGVMQLDVNVTVNTQGGAITTASGDGEGLGGSGGDGYFRYDTTSGSTTGVGSFSTTGSAGVGNTLVVSVLDPAVSTGNGADEYESELSAACTYKEKLPPQFQLQMFLSFLMGLSILGLFQRNKFRR